MPSFTDRPAAKPALDRSELLASIERSGIPLSNVALVNGRLTPQGPARAGSPTLLSGLFLSAEAFSPESLALVGTALPGRARPTTLAVEGALKAPASGLFVSLDANAAPVAKGRVGAALRATRKAGIAVTSLSLAGTVAMAGLAAMCISSIPAIAAAGTAALAAAWIPLMTGTLAAGGTGAGLVMAWSAGDAIASRFGKTHARSSSMDAFISDLNTALDRLESPAAGAAQNLAAWRERKDGPEKPEPPRSDRSPGA